MRRVAVWAVVVPLMLAGTEVAHALAYRIVYPVAAVRWHVLAATGHGYLGGVQLGLGIGVAVLVAGLASTVVDAARRRPTQSLPAWAFATLPIVGFTVQEFFERMLATNSLPWWMFEQPTFRVGLLLQLPFAALALVVAYLLMRCGRTIGGRLADGDRPAPAGLPSRIVAPASAVVDAMRVLGPHTVRGPPRLA